MSALAHKTLIDGTAYDIVGGSTLIEGTAYSIASGRTRVDGTGYDILFRHPYIWPGWDNATWADINMLCVAKQNGEYDAWPQDVVLGASKTIVIDNSVTLTYWPHSIAASLVRINDGTLDFMITKETSL